MWLTMISLIMVKMYGQDKFSINQTQVVLELTCIKAAKLTTDKTKLVMIIFSIFLREIPKLLKVKRF